MRKDDEVSLFRKKPQTPPFVTAVVAAGGSGVRMGGNKLLMELHGMPVLGRTLLALENCALVRKVIVAARADLVVEYGRLASSLGCTKVVKVVSGGETRLHSVYRACCEASAEAGYLAVQDAARPLTTPAEIERVLRAAFKNGSALAACPVRDTLRRAGEDGRAAATVDRERLYAAQTPQCADRALLLGALKKAIDDGAAVTDECMALERLGVRPALVETSPLNIKITAPEDLILAGAILEARERP